ncbi:hypothetical protein NP493_356g02033 [Ridgeia piscesae]|uniref:Cilia- and flagella-associated protein 61 N-terminal domain-containing protein n=1 Tax=Ridgeia piscesae TaxID=27915 RepID=A0AAD9L2Z1_RIDPI|nr:hypothetical protein NP493_356g02033 [Ridgeia piscesae]
MLLNTYGEYFLAELIEAQDDTMQCIVAEVDGAAIGFMSLTTEVDIDLLNDCFELGTFHGLRKPHEGDVLKMEVVEEIEQGLTVSRPVSSKSDISAVSKKSPLVSPVATPLMGSAASSRAGSQQGDEVKMRQKLADEAADGTGSILSEQADLESVKSEGDVQSPEPIQVQVEMPVLPPVSERYVPTYRGDASCFAIQLFVIDEKFEMRSVDFLSKAFDLFPDRDFCIISVPHLVPEFPLIQQFVVSVSARCLWAVSVSVSVSGCSSLLLQPVSDNTDKME